MRTRGQACRYLCYCLACLSVLLTVSGYFFYAKPGFVGGFLTAYEYSMKAFYIALIVPGVFLSLYFIGLGRRAAHQNVTLPLIFSTILLIYLLAAVALVDQYVYAHLDHGQGG